jgi:hypothetical protein
VEPSSCVPSSLTRNQFNCMNAIHDTAMSCSRSPRISTARPGFACSATRNDSTNHSIAFTWLRSPHLTLQFGIGIDGGPKAHPNRVTHQSNAGTLPKFLPPISLGQSILSSGALEHSESEDCRKNSDTHFDEPTPTPEYNHAKLMQQPLSWTMVRSPHPRLVQGPGLTFFGPRPALHVQLEPDSRDDLRRRGRRTAFGGKCRTE